MQSELEKRTSHRDGKIELSKEEEFNILKTKWMKGNISDLHVAIEPNWRFALVYEFGDHIC